jgi:hypothetical protein
MKLRILAQVNNNRAQSYRGTDRATPYYCDGLGDDHPANQAFFWYCQEGGELGVVHNPVKAQNLVDVYAKLNPPQYFEVVELTNKPSSATKSMFYGYDIAAEYNFSLLSWNLEVDNQAFNNVPKDDAFRVIQPLLRLLKQHFQPQLNSNGLFDDTETAKFCLESMMALQQIRPGLWENSNVTFRVIGINKIYPI